MTKVENLVPGQHLCGQIRLLFDELSCKLRALAKLVTYDLVRSDQLPFLQIVENFRVGMCAGALYCLKLFSRRVCYRFPLKVILSSVSPSGDP